MLRTLDNPELIIGLCSPMGTANTQARELIVTSLKKYNYNSVEFKVTTLMKELVVPGLALDEKPVERRYDSHINYANRLRAEFEAPDLMSMLCVAAIRAQRRKIRERVTDAGKDDKPNVVSQHAYIFDQFKRPEEIESLRQIYGRLFILVSIYSDKEARIRRLSERIANDHSISRVDDKHLHDARSLIARDETEDAVKAGQRLQDTFPLGDIFLNIDDIEGSEKILNRFLSAFFGSNITSPNKDEYGMYLAKSASLRSIDLSRQVGAAIVSSRGEVVTMGSNEVPRAGGGTYWCDDGYEVRDYVNGHDENDRIKRSLLVDVVKRLTESKLVETEKSNEELASLISEQASTKGSSLRDSQLMDLLEFGRVIHAEMCALCDAARLGKATKGMTLYVTTFPCHMCAKHIVAAGISRVVFIEPYPKSYAENLHRDSIIVASQAGDDHHVLFQPFVGISPFRYRELFQRGKRKKSDGELEKWVDNTPKPIVRLTIPTYLENETAFTKIFEKKALELKGKKIIELPQPLNGGDYTA